MSDKESTLKLVDEEYEKLCETIEGLDADQQKCYPIRLWSLGQT